MVINVRGTHGSGKSELVRRVMAKYSVQVAVTEEGRKRPIGYGLVNPNMKKTLFVPGSYENPCGGCDTISDVKDVYSLIRKYHAENQDILFEGILAQHSGPGARALVADGYDLRVIVLDVPIELSREGVNLRRQASGNTRELNPETVPREAKAVLSGAAALRSAGVDVRYAKTREEGLSMVLNLLGLGGVNGPRIMEGRG